MFMMKQSTRRALAVSTVAVCLAVMTDLANAQRQRRSARRPESVTTVTDPASAGRFSREFVTVPVRGRTEWKPPHVKGDTDFSGNGPEVWVRVQFLVQNNAVYRRVFMAAVETRSTLGATIGDNITTANGWSPMEKVWAPPAGKTVVELRGIGEKTDLLHEVLRGHRPHVRQTAVGRMQIFADRKGGDAGVYTRVLVDFNYDLPVVLQTFTSNYVDVHLPRTVDYYPPHIKGDRDFKGHGPSVNITVYLTHSTRQVNFVVFMKARETKSDWTTAAGYYTEVIYEAPAGKRIKAVRGKQKWENVVNYVDSDHEIDTFNDAELGLIHVSGDRRGNDAGIFTKVVFSNIEHLVLVELENE